MTLFANAAKMSATMLIAGSTVLWIPGAQALTEYDYCTAGGDTLSTGTTYVSSSGGTRWTVSKHSMIITGNSEHANNLNAKLRASSNSPTYWVWDSFYIRGGETYAPKVNKEIPRSSEMNTKADFDQFGGDPSCVAQIQLDGIDQ